MSKNIPNPIVKLGHSTKKNGEISFDIDGNKIKKMTPTQFLELLGQINIVKRKVMNIRGGRPVGDKMLNEHQYEEVVHFLNQSKKLAAVKAYKEFTGLGLKESKDAVDGLQKKLRISKYGN